MGSRSRVRVLLINLRNTMVCCAYVILWLRNTELGFNKLPDLKKKKRDVVSPIPIQQMGSSFRFVEAETAGVYIYINIRVDRGRVW